MQPSGCVMQTSGMAVRKGILSLPIESGDGKLVMGLQMTLIGCVSFITI